MQEITSSRTASLKWWFLALCAVTFLSRLQILGNPIAGWDEDFYLTAARFMTQGAVPYVDFWDRKPIGIFLIYYPAALVPGWGGVWAYQAMGLISIIATGWFIMRLTVQMGWEKGAGWAAIFYSLWAILLKGHDGQSPVFYNLLILAAAWIIVQSKRDKGHWFFRRIFAMFLCGLALQVKYSAIFECVYFGLYLIVSEVNAGTAMRRLVGRTAAYAAAGLAPSLIVGGWYFLHGDFAPFFQANISANLERGLDPVSMMVRNLAVTGALIAVPLLAAGVAAFRNDKGGMRQPKQRWLQRPREHRFLYGWLMTAVVGFLFFPPWFDHYGLPVLMVASVAAARFFHQQAHHQRAIVAFLLVAALAGQLLFFFRMEAQGRPDSLLQAEQAVGQGDGSLFIYRAPHALYWLTGRKAPTRFLFNGTLSTSRESASLGARQEDEMRRILMVEKPEVIAMRSPQTDRRNNEVWAVKHLLLKQLATSYRLKATVRMGKQDVLVYRRVQR